MSLQNSYNFHPSQCNPYVVCNITLALRSVFAAPDQKGAAHDDGAALGFGGIAALLGGGGAALNETLVARAADHQIDIGPDSCFANFTSVSPVLYDPHDGRPHVYTGFCGVSHMTIPSGFYSWYNALRNWFYMGAIFVVTLLYVAIFVSVYRRRKEKEKKRKRAFMTVVVANNGSVSKG